ncbi:MAG: 1-(5-phosphoribosyl)-5-((5-phosphoribosylamino)methylideneamino) imidazole-4-carboxamide isomerase [Fluviicola sp.]|jgi:phosphoribosylformimino-5-aminoimidazole carboxamide ribotide isomerase|uniref:1-(5-phosphoribosyl)-5-[(5- phosphoribosylamino)methylideneamino]imidazole-4- carboxamide isomerase n=1 Tax=Fluviicola sp. TaxID=1917219 RepID=UPI00260E5197|nr:1-(5-phosphoribosyl)-5-[(5-phosphoribosylamino)methylideneamino]imidazole-4-carboxamide isomerase [Fluviicola sp.]MDF3026236.1 1-(5-phosphoribosyl)-5-((5-phosphoribosylamino)methylideneamino) imidazole-4-carboxamide isomerase [Fluviicola sp.]
MIAIPAIDLINKRVVRLLQGNFKQQTSYLLDPLEYAKEIAESGLEYLHLVDLSGAKTGQLVHQSLLKEIAANTNLKVDFGGGIKSIEDIESLLESGANQVVIGSLCVNEPETVVMWIKEFGTERFILALDTDGISLKINGWQDSSGKTLEESMKHFSEFKDLTILTTDIRRDGTGTGPSLDLYQELMQKFPDQRWIASGGVESMSDLKELRKTGCYACVIGKALLDGKITLNELKVFNDAGI